MRFIVLTKSSKYSEYCVAGIDYDTGKWVRLVTENQYSHGALSRDDLLYEDGRECQLLDIISVETLGYDNNNIQPENVILDTDKYIKFLGKSTLSDVLDRHPAEIKREILGNIYPYVRDIRINEIGYSLILVKVNNLVINQVQNPQGNPKTKADFTYMYNRYENIPVTDYRFYSVENKTSFREAYIVVSIGTPYNNRYYKFVSAIYFCDTEA